MAISGHFITCVSNYNKYDIMQCIVIFKNSPITLRSVKTGKQENFWLEVSDWALNNDCGLNGFTKPRATLFKPN